MAPIETQVRSCRIEAAINGPVETRAKYHGDCLYVEHYHAHTGQFIIGAVFKKDARRDPGSFLGLLSEPP